MNGNLKALLPAFVVLVAAAFGFMLGRADLNSDRNAELIGGLGTAGLAFWTWYQAKSQQKRNGE